MFLNNNNPLEDKGLAADAHQIHNTDNLSDKHTTRYTTNSFTLEVSVVVQPPGRGWGRGGCTEGWGVGAVAGVWGYDPNDRYFFVIPLRGTFALKKKKKKYLLER